VGAGERGWEGGREGFLSGKRGGRINRGGRRGGKRRMRKRGKRGTIAMTKMIEVLLCKCLPFDPPLGSWGRRWRQQQVDPLVYLDAIVASLSSLLMSIREARKTMIQQSAVREDRGGEVGDCGPSWHGVVVIWLRLTTMTMRGHNDHDDDKAPQTWRTTSADAVEPCLKSNNQPL
jgi:hypothetical protein